VTGIAVVLQDGLDVRSKLHIHRIARIATIIPAVISIQVCFVAFGARHYCCQ
jgi:hypothetical protein